MLSIFSILAGTGTAGLIMSLGLFLSAKRPRRNNMGPATFRKLEQQLPDFLNAVSSGLSSGSSLLQSLEMSNEKTPRPLNHLMGGILNMVRAGMPLEKAMEKTAAGLKRGSLLLALYSMAASYRSGGNMVQSLSQLANLCRERENLRKKILASTAQSRMQGTVLVLVPVFFLIFLFFTSPESFSEVLDSSLGKKLLLAAGILQLLGTLMIKRMLRQEIL